MVGFLFLASRRSSRLWLHKVSRLYFIQVIVMVLLLPREKRLRFRVVLMQSRCYLNGSRNGAQRVDWKFVLGSKESNERVQIEVSGTLEDGAAHPSSHTGWFFESCSAAVAPVGGLLSQGLRLWRPECSSPVRITDRTAAPADCPAEPGYAGSSCLKDSRGAFDPPSALAWSAARSGS